MAFPNTLFPCIPPLHTEVSDEEFRLFHTIDRMLVTKLIRSLNRNQVDAIDVVAVLLWLERNKMSVNAVYKVLVDWPDHLVDILADQVVALLKWLENPILVWERRGDISLIQELCHQNVAFLYLHQRRLEILDEKKKIVTEMSQRAFREEFPRGFEDRNARDDVGFGIGGGVGVEGIVGGFVSNRREPTNTNQTGVQFGSASGYVHCPQELESNRGVGFAIRGREENNVHDHVGVRTGGEAVSGVGFVDVGGGFVSNPRERVNRNYDGVQFGSSSREVENNVGVGHAAGPVHGPRELLNYNHDGAGFSIRGRLINDPREIMNENHYGVGYGTATGLVRGRLIHDSPQLENTGVRFAAGLPVHVPQTVRTIIPDPPQYTINHNVLRFGTIGELFLGYQEPENINGGGADGFETVGGVVQGHRGPENINGVGTAGFGMVGGLVQDHQTPENINGGGSAGGNANEPSSNDGQILPNVPFGPRMGYVNTDGQIQRPEVNTRRPIPENELSVLLRGLSIQEEETDVHEDDRTVFLTFSRGYPLSEPEIWGFFTRKFGNFIQGIHLEEVAEGVQPLYARMVARNTSILPLICDVNIRTKFVINGKQVWAKKYVRKNNAPPPLRMSASTSTSHQHNPET